MNSFVFSIPDEISRSLTTSRRIESDLFTSGSSLPKSRVMTPRNSYMSEDTLGIIDMALDIVGAIGGEDGKTQESSSKTKRKQ